MMGHIVGCAVGRKDIDRAERGNRDLAQGQFEVAPSPAPVFHGSGRDDGTSMLVDFLLPAQAAGAMNPGTGSWWLDYTYAGSPSVTVHLEGTVEAP